jgi:glycosyltransferase involved in cell wall biosynthesis
MNIVSQVYEQPTIATSHYQWGLLNHLLQLGCKRIIGTQAQQTAFSLKQEAQWQIIQPNLKEKQVALQYMQQVDYVIHLSTAINSYFKGKQSILVQSIPPKMSWLAKRAFAKQLHTAHQIIVPNTQITTQLNEAFGVPANKIVALAAYALPQFAPVNFEQAMLIKDGNADGREYFVLVIEGHTNETLTMVLKAFSLFKKWQQSSMKLLLLNHHQPVVKDLMESLKTYRFREDVVVVDIVTIEQQASLIAAAYACIHAAPADGLYMQTVEAMQSKVPVLVNDDGTYKDVLGDYALYFEASDIESLGHQLKLLYRDESFRAKQIEQAENFARLQKEQSKQATAEWLAGLSNS